MNSPIEPSMDLRTMAIQQRGVFNAYVMAGFTEDQALQILLVILSAWCTPQKP